MKKLFTLIIILVFTCPVFAAHIKGGWIQYTFISHDAVAKTTRYQITVRQYLACNSTAQQRDAAVFVGVFDGVSNLPIGLSPITIPLSGTDNPDKTTFSPCINPVPPPHSVCYLIDRYTALVDLPDNTSGYTLTAQRCCRIAGIVNVSGNSAAIGVSYTTKIPGTISGVNYSSNSSPVFAQKDTVIVCFNSPFTLDFSATDADGDQLTYYFCDGYTGGDNTNAGAIPNPPTNPPYTLVPYAVPTYSGSSPMGASVTIDPVTGIISGIAPGITGDYVVSVCANEYRNGVLIGTTKKEIHISVADCSLSAAKLKPTYVSCNGTTFTFQNESTNSSITSYLWDFGVPSLTNDTSSNHTPTYDYLKSGKDSGTYTIKLKVASSGGCLDSTTAQVLIYPGFTAGFTITGTCYLNSYAFSDTSKTKAGYGSVNNWSWNFGDPTTPADTAHSKDSAWKYASPISTQVSLIVSNTKGCIDTVIKQLTILDKPVLNLPFRDTLICSIDTLALKVITPSGTILWTPVNGPNKNRILNPTTNSPLVFPQDTTKYYVSVNDNGCNNTDSVNVNVLQFISVKAGVDTGICKTDTIQLHPISDALSYLWTASTGVPVQNSKNPMVQPLVNTKYIVIANLGKCQAKDSFLVKVVPYPNATVGSDVTICYGSRVQLIGAVTGSVFFWSPTSSLVNENTLSPVAGPTQSTAYILTATDTIGCPKPKSATILVTVIPQIYANAGADTSVAANQPVQLIATGGTSYAWTPVTGLNNPAIANPVATLGSNIDSITYTVRVSEGNCYADDQVVVRVFKSGSDILVPSAFTPNADGKNDILKPILIGITKLNYFSIYSRWGELLFSTMEQGKGWDGSFNGIAQPGGAYVYQTEGVDYLGKTVYRKGTFVLVR